MNSVSPFARFLRSVAFAVVSCMVIEMVPATVTASTVQDAATAASHRWQAIKTDYHAAEVYAELQRKNAAIPKIDMSSLSKNPLAPLNGTMLDEVGLLGRPIDPALPIAWKAELAKVVKPQGAAQTARVAELNVWVGEYELANDKQPDEAYDHFAAAQHETATTDRWHGLAAYDAAVSLFYMGAYADASDAFHGLVRQARVLSGFPYGTCALFARHADACAGYHAQRAAMGITEPPRLDPLCGAAGLGAALRAFGKPFDEATVLKACKVTGEGSSMQDLVDAGPKLGLSVHAVQSDDKGLKLLPKPLVAYVERDHFVTVVKADNSGVNYLCIDCGRWPGMERHLTWKQWDAITSSHYGAMTLPGSVWDRALASLPKAPMGPNQMPGVQVASAGALSGMALTLQALQLAALLKGHVVGDFYVNYIICGGKIISVDCGECVVCCIEDALNPPPGTTGEYISGSNDSDDPGPGGPSGPGGPIDPGVESGPSSGDPVNVATGEEQYTPAPDLTVYNPSGPSVKWARIYNSMRNVPWAGFVGAGGAPAGYADLAYEQDDFGQGWSQTYNVGVYDPTNGGTGTRYIELENGARIGFSAASVPTSGSPVVACTPVSGGTPCLMEWDYSSTGSYYTITWKDRSKWITTAINGTTLCSALGSVVDRNVHAIHFNYTAHDAPPYGVPGGCWPLLASITDDSGAALLVVTRAADNSGRIASVTDRYGRTIYYHEGKYVNPNVPSGFPQAYEEVDRVSQIVSTGTSTIPDRYVLGYQQVNNGEGSEEVSYLHTISVPSPTGSGTATTTINYNSQTLVANIVDANGNTHTYQSVDGSGNPALGTNYTKVTDSNPGGTAVKTWTANYDNNMSGEGATNGSGQAQYTKTFSDPNDPYRASSVTDGNGHSANYSWDQFGNMTSETNVRGITTTYTWNYSHFALGELTSEQRSYIIGSTTYQKSPTSFAYADSSSNDYTNSGLATSISMAKPGTVEGTTGVPSTVTTSMTYDSLGNVLTVTTPGNGTVTSKVTTLGYTSDGSYTQTDAIGQPITLTDNLGNVTHLRYDSRGNRLSVTDALGNQTQATYNLSDQPTTTTLPATGQTGSGNAESVNAYLYAGGPLTTTTAYDESGNQSRQTAYSYGYEGEELGVSGSSEAVTKTYDALYRLATLSDGNGHATTYTYDTAGYLATVAYPDVNTGTGYDTISYTSYDAIGDPLTRIDGRGITTTYAYADPDNNLTSMSYSGSSTPTATLTWDHFGRRATLTDTSGSTTVDSKSYAYDDTDTPTSLSTTYGSLSAKTIGYTYNPDGSRATMTAPAGSGTGTFSYGYDGDGRETGMVDPYGNGASWSYGYNSWLSSQKSLTGATLSATTGAATGTTVTNAAYVYNAAAETTSLTNKNASNSTTSSFTGLTYDGAGDRTGLTATVTGLSAYSGTASYSYLDNGGHTARPELSSETSPGTGGVAKAYVYDGAGNPTTFRNQTGIAFNSDSQPTGNTYDGGGNPTTYGSASCTFDAENRMTAYGSAMTAGYDGDGLRTWKNNGTATTYYLYDGTTPVCEFNSSGTLTANNVFGPHGLISRTVTPSSPATTWYAFDAQGSVSQRISSSGSATSTDKYDAWGARTSTAGTIPDPFGYNAQWGYFTDVETGLVLCTHRYYDPEAGRWLTRDPMGYDGGVDLYGYCGNRSILFVDPSGTTVVNIGYGGNLDLGFLGLSGSLGLAIELPGFGSCKFGLEGYATGGEGVGIGLGASAGGVVGIGTGDFSGFNGESGTGSIQAGPHTGITVTSNDSGYTGVEADTPVGGGGATIGGYVGRSYTGGLPIFQTNVCC